MNFGAFGFVAWLLLAVCVMFTGVQLDAWYTAALMALLALENLRKALNA